jgi:hypothetical protein
VVVPLLTMHGQPSIGNAADVDVWLGTATLSTSVVLVCAGRAALTA